MYRQTAVVGIGQTEFSKESGRTEWELALEAILAAAADAGIETSEIDGIVRYAYDNVTQAMLARTLGIKDLRWYGEIPFGGIAQCGVVAQAAAAIVSGIASTVVVYRALNERSGVRYGRAERNIPADGEFVYAATDKSPSGQFSGPYGLHVPGQVMALWARRYAHMAGIHIDQLSEALGQVAIQQRRYANTNPAAMMRDRVLDWDIYLGSRMISAPLRLYDYCLESDGAAAMIITSADRARALRPDPTYILASQQSLYAHSEPITVYAADLTKFSGPGNIQKLYADARIKPEDVSLAGFYDATSFAALTGLETYGFAPHLTAWRYMIETGTGLDSPLPTNTHGGHLSEGYIHGLNHLTEAVRQLRGVAANQVPNAEIALVGCHGASSAIFAR
jgi:acetyl-CoA acetyltransferase